MEGIYLKISYSEVLFYLYWVVMIFIKALGYYEGMPIYNMGFLFASACIFLKLILEKHSVIEWLCIAGLLILGGICYLHSAEKTILIYILLIIGMKNVPVKRIFQIGLGVWTACFIYRAFLEVTGLRTGMVLVHEKLGLGPIIRWSFGYPHPNVLHITYAVIAVMILYLSGKKGKEQLKLLSWLFLGNCYIFMYSISYTGFALTVFCFIIFYYMDNRKEFSRFENILLNLIFPFCVLFSIAGPILTEEGRIFESLDPIINKLLNTRFLAARVYMTFGLSLWGKKPEQFNTDFALDSSYMNLLVRDGMILFVVVCISSILLIQNCLKKGKRKALAVILAFSIAGVSEPFLFNTSFKNLIFIFMGALFYESLSSIGNVGKISDIYVGSSLAEKEVIIRKWKNRWSKINCRNVDKKQRQVIGMACLVVFTVIMVSYAAFAKMPQRIYVAVGNTDCPPQEEFYLDTDEIKNTSDYIVYEYQGANMPLYAFEGNIIKIELIRASISWGVTGAFVTAVLLSIYFILRKECYDTGS